MMTEVAQLRAEIAQLRAKLDYEQRLNLEIVTELEITQAELEKEKSRQVTTPERT